MNCAFCKKCLFSAGSQITKAKCGHCFHRQCYEDGIKIVSDCPHCNKRMLPRAHIPLFGLNTNGADQANEENADSNVDANVDRAVDQAVDHGTDFPAIQNNVQQANEGAHQQTIEDNDANIENVQQAADQGQQADESTHQQANEHVTANVDHQDGQEADPNVENANNESYAIQHGHRTQRRTQSQHIGYNEGQPGRRTLRRANTEYDRNVHINRDWLGQPSNELEPNQLFRRSGRISKAVERFNISEMVCFVCKRKYRENQLVSRFGHFGRNIACSFKCFRKA